MILSSKAISVHICSKLCMVAFLSSISARYFHTIGVSSMFDAHFSCNYQHAPKDRKVTRHINVLFISKCIFPPFLQHTRKDRKIRPGPPVSRRRTFLSFPGLLYIHTYIYIRYMDPKAHPHSLQRFACFARTGATTPAARWCAALRTCARRRHRWSSRNEPWPRCGVAGDDVRVSRMVSGIGNILVIDEVI